MIELDAMRSKRPFFRFPPSSTSPAFPRLPVLQVLPPHTSSLSPTAPLSDLLRLRLRECVSACFTSSLHGSMCWLSVRRCGFTVRRSVFNVLMSVFKLRMCLFFVRTCVFKVRMCSLTVRMCSFQVRTGVFFVRTGVLFGCQGSFGCCLSQLQRGET